MREPWRAIYCKRMSDDARCTILTMAFATLLRRARANRTTSRECMQAMRSEVKPRSRSIRMRRLPCDSGNSRCGGTSRADARFVSSRPYVAGKFPNEGRNARAFHRIRRAWRPQTAMPAIADVGCRMRATWLRILYEES